ncbi:hypothetical protein GCM10009332_14680 [Shewanella gelidii]|uniref:Uncharacterized protein n=2 Tax=Shewanella gelidii TaxID=1642821 RepID=A0A917NAM6_9GAMM|nr:hypothetical protein GCM10009332_14680 [Shewanella gelidii]
MYRDLDSYLLLSSILLALDLQLLDCIENLAQELAMQKFKLDSLISLKNKGLLFQLMLWLTISCGGLLALPGSTLSILRLDQFVSSNAHFIGLGMIVGFAYLISGVLNLALDASIAHLTQKKVIQTVESKVLLLDPAERALLREFFLQGSTKLTLPQDEEAVKSLIKSSILECLGNERHYAIHGPTADYKISMHAREYLNRQVLRLPAGEPSQEEMQLLIRSRPHFVGGIVQPRKHAA